MTRRIPVSLGILVLATAPAAAAGKVEEAFSYAKPVPGGRYVFVMLGDPSAESQVDADSARKFRELRAEYPRTGLYREGSGELAWPFDGPYAPMDNVYPASDGVHLVVVGGEWWREKSFTGGRSTLSPEEEQKQLDGPAVGFYADGKLIRQYTVRDVVTDPAGLPQTPHYILWETDGSLNEDTGKFLLFTQDSN